MYTYTEEDEGFFTFVNSLGVKYAVIFSRDEFIFPTLNKEDTLVYELMVMPYEDRILQPDSGNGQTICTIIENFIHQYSDRVVVYLCETKDGKAKFRYRLFNRWFEQLNTDSSIHKLSIQTGNNYTSVILKDSNKYLKKIKEAVEYYIENPEILDDWIQSKNNN